jgi:hypothetical protein
MHSLELRLGPLFGSHSLDEALDEADQLLPDIEVGVTFWGSRVLRICPTIT